MSHLVTLMPKPDNRLILLRDTFTDTNGVTLDAHTPDYNLAAGVWNKSDWQISSNTAVNTVVVDASIAINTGQSDVYIEAVCNAGTDLAGVVFRYTDSNNQWACYASVGDSELQIWQRATTWTKRAAVAYVPSGAFTLVVTVVGAVVTAQIGATAVSYASMAADLTATNHGMRLGQTGTACSIDSILIRRW